MLRLGEVTIKSSRVRSRFEGILISNIIDALKRHGVQKFSFEKTGGRIFVEVDREDVIEVLRRVFGITSLSKVYPLEFESLDDIVRKAEKIFAEHVKGRKFAVRVRRTGDHDFTSLDVAREVGAVLYKYSKGVDLKNPDVEVYVEVRGRKAYFYKDVIRAYGGLPIGSEGRVVALVSGGFDSAVAAWYMLKRGAEVEYVFCNLGGRVHKIGVINVIRVLAEKWSYGYKPRLHIVDFSEIMKEIIEKCDRRLAGLVFKRLIYRVAEKIAEEVNAKAIVTGESLGQVSSQTLQNLYVTSLVVHLPIFRPLIGFDKDEIIKMAKEIGTYSASERVKEYCAIFSYKPKTRARVEEVEEEERKIDFTLLEKAIKEREVVDLLSISLPDIIEKLEVTEVPEDAVVIDIRDPSKYLKWHYPGAINIPFYEIVEKLPQLDRNKKYVFYCEEGSLSLDLAYEARNLGIKAYSIRGGAEKLRKRCEKSKKYENNK